MIYYRITSLETNWALSVNKDNAAQGSQLIVSSDPQNDFQLWDVSFHGSSDWNVGIILINKATGLLSVPEYIGNDAKVIQVPVPADCNISNNYAWQTNIAGKDANTQRSIMPLMNDNQALSCWHSPNVLTYAWHGGKGREIWTFNQVIG